MLKIATAASILLASLCAPIAWADSVSDSSGFGNASMPSETTNTQYPEAGIQGEQPLAEPGISQKTGKGVGNRNLSGLPPVGLGSIALKNQGLSQLQDARYAVLSQKNADGSLPDARYAVLGQKNADGSLPDARYAVLSDGPFTAKSIIPKQASSAIGTVLSKASEGF